MFGILSLSNKKYLILAVPTSARNLTALAGNTSIALTWEPPETTQGAILRYEIRIFNNLEQRNYTIEDPGLSFTATGFLPFTSYTVEVVPVNRYGRGYPTSRITVLTLEEG